jgi:hypothetical protein
MTQSGRWLRYVAGGALAAMVQLPGGATHAEDIIPYGDDDLVTLLNRIELKAEVMEGLRVRVFVEYGPGECSPDVQVEECEQDRLLIAVSMAYFPYPPFRLFVVPHKRREWSRFTWKRFPSNVSDHDQFVVLTASAPVPTKHPDGSVTWREEAIEIGVSLWGAYIKP